MITVVGVDGGPLPAAALTALQNASLVVGGARHLAAVPVPERAQRVVMGDVEGALDDVERHPGAAVVLASGDPGFFGVVRRMRERQLRFTVLPAVSSVARAFARAGLPWDDAVVVSAHGRDLRPAANACRARPKVAVLTAPGAGPAELAEELGGPAPVRRTFLVAECLGSADERVTEVPAARAVERSWADPNVVLALATAAEEARRGWVFPRSSRGSWALDEAEFDHRDGMVTKSEVRALALPRLAPALGRMVWDIGAGSGSVGIECARLGSAVVAVERDGQQCARVRSNAQRHGVDIPVVQGAAPAALAGLPAPDAVFVGGGGLPAVEGAAASGADTLVVALAALDRFAGVKRLMSDKGYAVDGTLVSTSRLTALPDGSSRLAATNPVLLVTGSRS